MWTSTVKIDQYIDTPMHLIFQGIVKSLIEFSFLFLKYYKNKQVFKSHVHDMIHKIKL